MIARSLPWIGTATLVAVAGTLGVQVERSLSNPPQIPQVATKPVPVLQPATTTDDGEGRSPRDDSFFTAITQKPLFEPTRRPVPIDADVAPPPEQVTRPLAPVPPSGPPAISVQGVIGIGLASKALLAPDGAPPEWVVLGEQIAGWTLTEIGPDWVVLTKSEQQFRLDMYQ